MSKNAFYNHEPHEPHEQLSGRTRRFAQTIVTPSEFLKLLIINYFRPSVLLDDDVDAFCDVA